MLKLALVTAAEWPHGKTFSGLFNGIFDPNTGKPTQAADPRLAGARITRIWDANKKAAQELADRMGASCYTLQQLGAQQLYSTVRDELSA